MYKYVCICICQSPALIKDMLSNNITGIMTNDMIHIIRVYDNNIPYSFFFFILVTTSSRFC